MKYWDEVRTVARVARLGTVSAAARALGVHRSTVQRHVDRMEEALGIRLFLKHARGYAPTEAALELRRVAETAENAFTSVTRKIELTDGDFTASVSITALPDLSPLMVSVLREICRQYPGLRLEFIASADPLSLETGEADIAVRIGQKPDHPDYIVQPLETLSWRVFASPTYVARHGLPRGTDEFDAHFFAGPISEKPRLQVLRWIIDQVPNNNIVIRSNDVKFLEACVLGGAAIGLLPTRIASDHEGMVEIEGIGEVGTTPVWLVTHVDQHRRPKIQASLSAVKSVFRNQKALQQHD